MAREVNNDLESLNKKLEFFNREYEKSIKIGDYNSEYKLSNIIISIQNQIRNLKNKKRKSGEVDILFDKNGLIIDGEKTKENIEKSIYNLEKKYNELNISEEEREEISSNIILLKQDLKRVNNCIIYKEDYLKKSKEKEKIRLAIEKITKQIDNMFGKENSDRSKIETLNEISEKLDYLYQKTIDFDDNLNKNISDAIMQINNYKNVLYKNILPKKKKVLPNLIKDFKVIFDASTGIYKFEYSRYDGEKYIEEKQLFVIDKNSLSNIENDENLLKNLEEFDNKFNTNFSEKLINDDLNFEIIYDLRKFTKNLSSSEKRKVQKIALNQKKNFNAKIVRSPLSKIASVAAVAIAAGTLIFVPQNLKNSNHSKQLKNDNLTLTKTLTMNK